MTMENFLWSRNQRVRSPACRVILERLADQHGDHPGCPYDFTTSLGDYEFDGIPPTDAAAALHLLVDDELLANLVIEDDRASGYVRVPEHVTWEEAERSRALTRERDELAVTVSREDREARRFYARMMRRQMPPGISRAVWDRDGWTCKACGDHRNLTVDHVHPLIEYGTNDLDNLQTLCGSCNSRKGART